LWEPSAPKVVILVRGFRNSDLTLTIKPTGTKLHSVSTEIPYSYLMTHSKLWLGSHLRKGSIKRDIVDK
jgi:hypothetical protein